MPLFGLKPACASVGVLREHVAVELRHEVAEHDRVGDLHHGRLQVHREQHVLRLRVGDLRFDEAAQRLAAHHRCVDDFAGLHGRLFLQHLLHAVGRREFDLDAAGVGDQADFSLP
jgi:hypothetical protein